MRVLVFYVEDEEAVRSVIEVMVNLLLDQNVRGQTDIRFFESAERAMEAVEYDRMPDVVVCDERMPGIQGTDLLRRWRDTGWDGAFLLCSGEQPPTGPAGLLALRADFMIKDSPRGIARWIYGKVRERL